MKTLEDLRKGSGLTQIELANLFGVSSRTIQNYETDSSNIRDNILSKYMKAFNVNYDDIFLGTEYEIFEFKQERKHNIIIRIKKQHRKEGKYEWFSNADLIFAAQSKTSLVLSLNLFSIIANPSVEILIATNVFDAGTPERNVSLKEEGYIWIYAMLL